MRERESESERERKIERKFMIAISEYVSHKNQKIKLKLIIGYTGIQCICFDDVSTYEDLPVRSSVKNPISPS